MTRDRLTIIGVREVARKTIFYFLEKIFFTVCIYYVSNVNKFNIKYFINRTTEGHMCVCVLNSNNRNRKQSHYTILCRVDFYRAIVSKIDDRLANSHSTISLSDKLHDKSLASINAKKIVNRGSCNGAPK